MRVPSNPAFRAFLQALWPEAEAAGVSRATFDAALAAVPGPDPAVLARAGAQSEFSRPVSTYVEGAASAASVARGRALAATWADVLERVESRTGVPRAVILAVWSIESGYGRDAGSFGTLRSLATLAASGDRAGRFRSELIAAFRILETERMDPSRITGSWAGAMGQTQFLPSSFLAHAADGDGDGRRDIWTSVPDVLASIGKFLADAGWRADLSWGYEVVLPPGLDLADFRRSLSDWNWAGVGSAAGPSLPSGDAMASLYFPAGIGGPAILLTEDFEALRAYNTSDAYALAVGVLADRIAGGGPLRRPWPAARPLSGAERREIHDRLAAAGLYQGIPDGKFGARSRDAIRHFQTARRLPADGFADPALLDALRRPSGKPPP